MKKIAIPTEKGKLCTHFGHCETFAIVEIENDEIRNIEYRTPPVHQPGVYPKFLADNGVSVIISGGMGMKAQDLFAQKNIEVCVGVQADAPEILVKRYLEGKLETGKNRCDH